MIKFLKRLSNDHKKSHQDYLIDRLHRVEGQIKGITKMIEADRDCLLVIHQVLAARNALGKIATKLLAQEACRYDLKERPKDLETIINQLIKFQ